jgi:pyruvate-formate lyase-activating enzyme
MVSKIFYGTGQNVYNKLYEWITECGEPVLFADEDYKKWGTKFSGTKYEITSITDAITRYPNYEFWITATLENCRDEFDYLVSLNIPRNRIKFCENLEWRKGCSFIGTFVWFGRTLLKTCFYPNGEHINVKYSGNLVNDYEMLKKNCDNIIQKWRNKESSICDGCFILKENLWAKQPTLTMLSLYGGFSGERCNFKCCYCDAQENLQLSNNKDSMSMVEAINQFGNLVGNDNFAITLSAGEITVSPYKKEIFNLIKEKDLNVAIFTNGFIFDENIYELMKNRKASMNISIDAGSRETYTKIKGVDCYDKVLQNIEKYALAFGHLELKYIILEGINDNESDIDGFIEICSRFATSIRLSCNKFRADYQFSEYTWQQVVRFIKKVKKMNIHLAISYSQFNNEDCFRIDALLNQ